MKKLPATDAALFVRTDFGDSDAWETICNEIRQPPEDMLAAFAQFAEVNAMIGQDVGLGPQANLTIVDDAEFANLTPVQLVERLSADSHQTFLFVVDHESITSEDHSILVVDVSEQKGGTFRATPEQIQGIENNLSIANMDFADFANAVDDKGVFRGF
jgi:hypothetical protein